MLRYIHFNYFLSMHAWGNRCETRIAFNPIVPIHARMGKPTSALPSVAGGIFQSMHAWGNPTHMLFSNSVWLLIHARMGKPKCQRIFAILCFFLSMHAWGDQPPLEFVPGTLLPIHARMGRPSGRVMKTIVVSSYPCTHGATSYYNYLINKDNLTILTFADFCYTFFGMKRY